ncbi:MAG: hypothetical protein PHF35_00935 [Candidatus Moranbacteria bacterium]|nr:hypothetical protein [Candidatus Moranbacteria bacterium]
MWYYYVWKSDWSAEKKQQYISEQAKFTFNKTGYQKMVEIMNSRREKLLDTPAFDGKDIFFPTGF